MAIPSAIGIWQHTLETCDCAPTHELAGCQHGYTWVVDIDGIILVGGFLERGDAIDWLRSDVGAATIDQSGYVRDQRKLF